MLTETGKFGFTVIVKILEVAELSVIFDVITQDTSSPFDNEVLVYVELFVPTLNPLSFH